MSPPPAPTPVASSSAETDLVDLLDRLLDKGVFAAGGILISLAGVDLVRLDLRLLLTSAERLLHEVDGELSGQGLAQPAARPSPPLRPEPERPPAAGGQLEGRPAPPGERLRLEPENVERGLARLVVTLLDVLRQVLERQSIRRLKAGSLAEDEVERLGLTLRALERGLGELRDQLDTGSRQAPAPVDWLFPTQGAQHIPRRF